MNVKEFLKPTILKILIFTFIGAFYLYFARESVCAAGLFFAFCYNAYGFPLYYLVAGNIAPGHVNTLFLGEYFTKSGNFLFNPATLFLDAILIYLLSCFMSLLFKNTKSKN